MYDWITASYDISEHNYKTYVQKMVTVSEVKNMFTGSVWSNGYLTNSSTGRKMGVSISDKRIKVKLCPNKFIMGNNVEEAPLFDVHTTLEGLSNILELDLGLFILEKLDVTHTAQTEYVPEAYFPYLCNNNGFTRWQQNTSLYYNSNSTKVQKVFYDKVNEVNGCKPKTWGGKQKIPEALKGKNLTRFECRLGSNKQIRDVIGHNAFVGQLFVEEHVEQLQRFWISQYEMIPKTTNINWKFTEQMGQKHVDEQIIKVALSQLGRLTIENLIELADKQGAYKFPSQKTASKTKLLGMFDEGIKHNLIEELDAKFNKSEPIWEGKTQIINNLF